jgi:hypothetical protein
MDAVAHATHALNCYHGPHLISQYRIVVYLLGEIEPRFGPPKEFSLRCASRGVIGHFDATVGILTAVIRVHGFALHKGFALPQTVSAAKTSDL